MSVFRVVPSATLERWDIKQVLVAGWTRPAAELAPFGDVAERRIEPNRSDARYGSVHFDGRVTQRSADLTIKGATYLAHPGDIVFSRIDVRNGAIAVVPERLGRLAFTNEYPVYDLAEHGRLLPEFVALLCRTTVFRSLVQSMVVGHSGRKRVPAELFETIPIPVPPHPEQRSIVRQYQVSIARAERLRQRSVEARTDAVLKITDRLGLRSAATETARGPFVVASHEPRGWSVTAGLAALKGIKEEVESLHPMVLLGGVGLAEISYGISKSPRNRPGAHSRPYLRVANVQDGYLDLSEIKQIEVPDSQMDRFRLEPGDVLLCEGNSAELVGRPAMWSGEIDDCVHQNHVLRVRCNPDELLPGYLLAYMQTAVSRAHFRGRAKNTTNLSTINSTDVKDLPVPLPGRGEQRRVADIWTRATKRSADLAMAAIEAERRALAQSEARIAGSAN